MPNSISLVMPYVSQVSKNSCQIITKAGPRKHPAASRWQKELQMLVRNRVNLGAELKPPMHLQIDITVGNVGRMCDWQNFIDGTLDAVARGVGVDDGHDNYRIDGSVKRGHPAQIEVTIEEVEECGQI